MTTYDDIPYPSYGYPQATPSAMSAIGQVFSLSPAGIEKATVLEIGCASGGNIIPLAVQYPDATFVGVDLSENQIAQANALVAKLNLTNVTFIAGSIDEVEFPHETYDYIMAHGVFSWVPSFVQDAILKICGERLSDNGLAYLSYNTLPGWNAVKTVRDMMLYHGQRFSDPAKKVREARQMLKFVADNLGSSSGAYKTLLEQEVKTLQNADDNYLLHDHLEAINEPCYFHEFMSRANEAGLSYVGDSELPSMYLGNHSDKVKKTLAPMTNVIEQEQYLDFISNRRFRMTVLTRKGHEIKRSISSEVVKKLCLIPLFGITPDQPNDQELRIKRLKEPELIATISGEVAVGAYKEIINAFPKMLSFDQVFSRLEKKLDKSSEEIERDLSNLVVRFLFSGLLAARADAAPIASEVNEKPEVFSYARLQAEKQDVVTNLKHDQIKLKVDQRILLQYLDGKNDAERIRKELLKHIASGELNLNKNGDVVAADSPEIDTILKTYLDAQFGFFLRNSLLIEN
ncbi:methyltransferase domain-containing protein [Sneathiella sp. P13V-1]|uniref:class I SAM-dependent methyltransferase n=1 Tax=Sneathiella sp. P13V-1 TaxID=2697366 RepID=UPI00187B29A5|nr:class I SAM-dependent methyltransferase [Sneathiella sp. P13V-1]MBE7637861.1 methyltransferase domain-containing protein [Sneathiella sp. P13V-1]